MASRKIRSTLDLVDHEQLRRVDETHGVGDGCGPVLRKVKIAVLRQSIARHDSTSVLLPT